ncbi:MAG TPA: DinB family protein [Ignavibacteria bacterium]|nr:DinB family protein [Ignavibacteria bacterium]
MYHSLEEFYKDWAYESSATLKLLNLLTDESLNQRVTPDSRSLGFLANHLAHTIVEMPALTGIKVKVDCSATEPPSSAKEIAEIYKKASDSLIEEIKKNWNDKTLEQEDNMYGEIWKRGYTLYCLILHQTHHRGQMTVLMRQAGLKVVGMYGPAKEEWAEMGMPAME